MALINEDARPLVAHVVYRFDTGGLENGIVNLINNMSVNSFRHVVVSLTDSTDFRNRVEKGRASFVSLHKPPGQGFRIYPELFKLFRSLRPSIVHTRNLAALEAQVPALCAGVKVRIHGEHGRDVEDLDGSSKKYQFIRRIYRPFVQDYVALSRDLSDYLGAKIHVKDKYISQIYNGVDTNKFHLVDEKKDVLNFPFFRPDHWVVGSVGRMQTVKDHPTLVRAFIKALTLQPALRSSLRLVIIGDGSTKAECCALLEAAGMLELAWLPGERADVDKVMRGFDCFVLPSLAEGISNTILEAMASGLPVIATRVGGNADLVLQSETGELVPASNVEDMANSLVRLCSDKILSKKMGLAGRARVEQNFSLDAMVGKYQALYERLLQPVSLHQSAHHMSSK